MDLEFNDFSDNPLMITYCSDKTTSLQNSHFTYIFGLIQATVAK